MNRRSILPQKGKVVKDKILVKSTARKSLSIPENARKKRNYIEKKKKDVEDDIKNSSGSWEEMEAGSSSSSLTWLDYLPSGTYNSDSEESSTLTSKTSRISDTSPIEDTRSRATYFADDFDDIVQTVDGYLNQDEDFKGHERRTVMSLDASGITTSAMKDPNRMFKFLPKLTSTLLRGSKSGISIDTEGGENSDITLTNQESNVKPSNSKGPEVGLSPELIPPEMRLLSKISEPEEPAPPCMDNSLTEELKIPETFSPRNNAFEIQQQSKDYSHQVLGGSRHEKRIFNHLNKSSTGKPLVHENVLSTAADQASQRQKIPSSKKIHESEINGKQNNFKGPEKRTAMSPDASSIATPTVKKYHNRMSKFVPKLTSSLLHGSKSRISIDAGEISEIIPTSQESKVKPSTSRGPEVGLSPERTPLEMKLLSDQISRRRKIQSSKKIRESRRNGKQKRIPESAEPPFMEDTTEELRIPNASGINGSKKRSPQLPSTEETLTGLFSTKSKTFEKNHSAKNYEFQVLEDIEPVSKYEKESFNIFDKRPIEYARNLRKEKNKNLDNQVPICPLFDLFQMNPNTRLKDLSLKQKLFKHRNRKAEYANVDICPLEIAPVSCCSGLRQVKLVSSKENLQN